MIYIKRVTSADITRQIDLTKETANSFFVFNPEVLTQKDLTFTEELSRTSHNGTIKKTGHTITIIGSIFSYIKQNCNLGDIVVFSTTRNDAIFNFRVIKSDSNDYAGYDQALKLFGSKSGVINETTHLIASVDDIDDNNNELDLPLQQIFYGAPGTGKSFQTDLVAKQYDCVRTTFHPDSDYSTFVGAYKPQMEEVPVYGTQGIPTGTKEKKIVYKYTPQAFMHAYIQAWKDLSKPVFLVIEEINRGNCAQIFGDIFQLLDRKDDGYSSYAIKADGDISQYLADVFAKEIDDNAPDNIKDGSELLLPPNLYIWATMNTSDQSLFPIDSAFKRRWDWKYVPIDTRKESWSIDINGTEYSWSSFLEKINDEIGDTTSSEDKKLGFYFCKADDGVISCDRFVSKVLFYIYNDVFKDYGLDREFFKDKDNNNRRITFQNLYKMNGDVDPIVVEKLLYNLDVEKLSEGAEDNADDDTNIEEDGTRSRDTTRYEIEGESGTFNKCSMVLKIADKYIQQYPEKTAADFVREWSEIGNLVKRPQLVLSEADYNDKISKSTDARMPNRFEKVSLSDGVAYISRGYTITQMPILTQEFSNRWGITVNVIA